MTVTPPPKGTGPGGRELWGAVTDEWLLDEHELALLRELVRVVDRLDALAAIVDRDGLMITGKTGLRVHPAAVEARQLAIAEARLLAALRLPDGEEDGEGTRGRRQRRVGVRGTYRLRAV